MKKSNFVRTIFARSHPWTDIGDMILWFSCVRYEANPRSVSKRPRRCVHHLAVISLYRAQIQCVDSNHGLASTTLARAHPYTTLGKQLLSTQESALSVFVSHRGSRHLYFTTRGLVDTFCRAFFVELHVLVSLR